MSARVGQAFERLADSLSELRADADRAIRQLGRSGWQDAAKSVRGELLFAETQARSLAELLEHGEG